MSRDVSMYLNDVLESLDKIEAYTTGITAETFRQNTALQDAVLRRLAIIGEAVKQIPPELKGRYPALPWKEMAGLRDVLIHQYTGVSLDRVWKVVTDEVRPAKSSIVHILADLKAQS